MQVRIDSDLRPLVRQHAKEQSRSIPAEVNHRLRKAYEEPYSQSGTQGAIDELKKIQRNNYVLGHGKLPPQELKRSIGTSLL